jgi:hypothetical protein
VEQGRILAAEMGCKEAASRSMCTKADLNQFGIQLLVPSEGLYLLWTHSCEFIIAIWRSQNVVINQSIF